MLYNSLRTAVIKDSQAFLFSFFFTGKDPKQNLIIDFAIQMHLLGFAL